uniref:Uncharacterized protein n=1 Tax=Arundo donax TaxID=35708 RepID=A0A0A8Y4I7_ARUDO
MGSNMWFVCSLVLGFNAAGLQGHGNMLNLLYADSPLSLELILYWCLVFGNHILPCYQLLI